MSSPDGTQLSPAGTPAAPALSMDQDYIYWYINYIPHARRIDWRHQCYSGIEMFGCILLLFMCDIPEFFVDLVDKLLRSLFG